MSECNTIYDTPVRRDELTITRTSLRSRVLISTSNQRTAKEKRTKSTFSRGKEKQVNELSFEDISHGASVAVNKGECCSEPSVMESESIHVMPSTASEYVDPFSCSSGDIDMAEGSSVQEQRKHSTPRSLKFPTRAVSSTPSQDSFSSIRFAVNVFTQTNLTLNARDLEEFSDDLKFFCVEIPVERMKSIPSSSHSLSNGNTPPLRCTRKLINCEKTPVHNTLPTMRKLSLRSKTMICSAIEKTKDKPNILDSHKSVEEKRLFSNTFSILPHLKTPPSCSEKVFHNPFEVDLPERLRQSVFSPDWFEKVVSPTEDSEYLRWTIEDISSINPVPIEEDFTFPSDDEDPEKESQVQQEIDRYFSETHLILSPYDAPRASFVNTKEHVLDVKAVSSTPQKVEKRVSKQFQNASTQTALTLPEVLPVNLEKSLRSYFKAFETDEFNLSASNLRRKLFFHSEDEPPSPVRFETHSSPVTNGCSAGQSPCVPIRKQRHFTPLAQQQAFSSPEISPVVHESTCVKTKNESVSSCKKTLHHYFADESVCLGDVKEPVVSSTVIMHSDDATMDSSIAPPPSQDTGYHTEESWRNNHHLPSDPSKNLTFPSAMMASTPAHRVN